MAALRLSVATNAWNSSMSLFLSSQVNCTTKCYNYKRESSIYYFYHMVLTLNSIFSLHFCLWLNSGKKSPPQWLDGMLKEHGIDFLISKFEGGGLLSQPTLRDLTGPFSVRATLQWMDLLLAALDCYNTFINLHIIKPHHMLSKFYWCSGWQFIYVIATHISCNGPVGWFSLNLVH